jgi:hypothetical protein
LITNHFTEKDLYSTLEIENPNVAPMELDHLLKRVSTKMTALRASVKNRSYAVILKGLKSFSPAFTRSGYAGQRIQTKSILKGLYHRAILRPLQLRWSCEFPETQAQGSAGRATLGLTAESRWDSFVQDGYN